MGENGRPAVATLSEVRSSTVVACQECGVYWHDGIQPAACEDPAHAHPRLEVHLHRDVVTLPDGTAVTAVSFDPGAPYERAVPPDFGCYLDARWQPPWPSVSVAWPDFGVPEDVAGLRRALAEVLGHARAGGAVELGCAGGHGRTGTALGCLAVLAGHPPADAVAWVRAHYCDQAVETAGQAAFVQRFTP